VTLYLDTSHLVTLYFDEPDSQAVHQLVRDATIVATSVLAYPEARATFARRRRERLISTAQYQAVVRQFEDDWSRLLVISLSDGQARAAGLLAETLPLRGGDAVHLAAFEMLLAWAGDNDVRFSCADEALVRAARRLG
jgi:predicted nucleic acid-binding protein